MRLLLDTHVFLWAITDDARLGPHSRQLITQEADSVLLSHVAIWEIAIKHALARSDMPLSAAQAIAWAQECGFDFLPLDLPHLLTLEQLPHHHRDPFDRLLVAQSIRESLTLLSGDGAFAAYGCSLQNPRH
ncbi:type II toxin-antitoxin system VapC family toxin [Synechococcus sp. CCY 9618]|uniref:type II toxin-antitoxin system VapC family toxin n=1 Tax=Synechococcus sp. CCY 9618 TaxID=2815602 RepID=UPI001C23A8D9|nr:type II toxin-antitoxin system VapC family toxin [Synechococcus sp. CCY 9618]